MAKPLIVRRAGFTIIEVLMALAILSLLGVSISSVVSFMGRNKISVQERLSWNLISNQVNLVLNNKEACVGSFQNDVTGTAINLNTASVVPQVFNIASLVTPVAGVNTPVLTVGSAFENQVRPSAMSLTVIPQSVGSKRFNATLRVQAERQGADVGKQLLDRLYRFYVVTSAAGGLITDCYGGFSMEDMCVAMQGTWLPGGTPQCQLQWMRTDNNVYLQNSLAQVAIGVNPIDSTHPDPNHRLEVNGVARFPGLNLRPQAVDPTTPEAGEIWMQQ